MEFSTLNGYKVKDKKAIRYYDTVADMKSDTTLKNGMHVKTKGYYNINDGGSAEYHITNTLSLTEYQESLENNLYANLIIKSGIYIPEQFGAIGNGTEDCSDIFNLIFSKMNHNNKLLLTQTYLIDSPLYLPNKNNIVISGGTLKGGSNLSGYILNSNQTAVTNYSGWEYKTENLTIENLFIDGNYTANGIYLDNYLRVKIISCTIHNILNYGVYLNNGHEAQLIGTNIIGKTNGDEDVQNTGIYIDSYDNIIDSCVIAYCQWAIDILKQNNQINNSHFYCNRSNGGNIKITKASFCSLVNNYFDGSGVYAINPYNITIDNNIIIVSDSTQHVFKFTKDISYITVRGIYITNTIVNDNRTDKSNNYDLISCDFNPNVIENCVIDNITAVTSVNVNNPYNIFSFKNNNIPVIIPDSFFRSTNNNNTIGTHESTENFYTYTYNGNYIDSVYTGSTSVYPWLFFKIYVPEKMLIKKEMISNTSTDIAFFDSNETYLGNNRVTLEKGIYYVGIYRTHTVLLSTK